MAHPSVSKKGFTLIELLIVVAIIGILAALILGALALSRAKSADVKIKSDVRQLRVLAEDYYDANQLAYDGFSDCAATPNETNCLAQETANSMTALKTDLETASGNPLVVAGQDDQFCIGAQLRSSSFICADATGQVAEQPSTDNPCNDTDFACVFN